MNELDVAANFKYHGRATVRRPSPISAGTTPTCPKCGSTDLEQPSPLVPAINPHASTDSFGGLHSPPLHAVNPDSNIRCICCDSRFHESDVDTAGARFAHLRSEYAKKAG